MLQQIHQTIANMALYYTFIVGVWGLVLFLRRRGPDGNFNGAVAIAAGIFAVQAVVGLILVLTGLMPANGIHFLYGVSTFLTIPLAFTLTRGRTDSRSSLISGLALMFLWGLSLRAFDTAFH
jgi:heme A synthase